MEEKTEVKGIFKVREGVFINKDNEALKMYKTTKQKEARFIAMEKEISQLKSDMAEIKELLKGLIK